MDLFPGVQTHKSSCPRDTSVWMSNRLNDFASSHQSCCCLPAHKPLLSQSSPTPDVVPHLQVRNPGVVFCSAPLCYIPSSGKPCLSAFEMHPESTTSVTFVQASVAFPLRCASFLRSPSCCHHPCSLFSAQQSDDPSECKPQHASALGAGHFTR